MLDGNIKNVNSATAPLCSAVLDYASRLKQCVPDNLIVKTYREQYPHQFQELCVVHLSFIIDIPWKLIEQPKPASNLDSQSKSAFKRFLAGCRFNLNTLKQDHVTADEIPLPLSNNLIALIDRLDNDEACSMEGIFRKAGHNVRKRQLQDVIFENSSGLSAIEWNKYSYHDMASALKSILMHLATPLLTKRLMPLFLQVSALHKDFEIDDGLSTTDSTNSKCRQPFESHRRPTTATRPPSNLGGLTRMQYSNLIEGKQLKALRLLIQLLPATNVVLLKRLVRLLSRVKQLQHWNRMSTECLGTIFGPVLLPQGFIHDTVLSVKNSKTSLPLECQERCRKLTSMLGLIFETGSDIFLLPRALVDDIYTNTPQLTATNVDRCEDSGADGRLAPKCCKYVASPVDHHHHEPESGRFWKNREAFVGSTCLKSPCCTLPPTVDETPPLRTGIRFVTPLSFSSSVGNQTISCRHSNSNTLELNEVESTSSNSSRSPVLFSGDLNLDSPDDEEVAVDQATAPCVKWVVINENDAMKRPLFTNGKTSLDHNDDPNVSCVKRTHQSNSQLKSIDQSMKLTPYLIRGLDPSIRSQSKLIESRTKHTNGQDNTKTKYSQLKIDIDRSSNAKHKLRRRRRFTELQLPTTACLKEPSHSKRTFSPCPIVLLPMKRNACSRHISP